MLAAAKSPFGLPRSTYSIYKILHVYILFVTRYKSPREAEAFYRGNLSQVSPRVPLNGKCIGVQTEDLEAAAVVHMFRRLPPDTHLQVLSKLFSSHLSAFSSPSVPEDFLCHAAAAIVRLHEGGRTNILYNLAKGIGTSRPDGSDALFPIKQMPMGLVEYIALFFVTDNLQKVQIFYYYVF